MPLILLTIVVALAAGVAAERRSNRAALRARALVLRTMLWGLVPFAIYVNIARLHLSLAVGVGVLAGYAALTLDGTLAWLATRGPLRLARPSAGAAIVCTIQANTAYLGLPLCAALFTHAQLTQAIAYDSLVSIPAFVLGSFTIGTLFGDPGRERERRRLRDLVLRNPPLLAVVAGLLVPEAWAPHALVEPSRIAIFSMLPLGFFVVGITLADEADEGALSFPPPLTRPVALVTLLRMALTPAVLGLVSVLIVTLPAPFLVLAAMPVGINTVLVAHATGLDLRLTSASIAWTTTVAFAGVLVLWATGVAGLAGPLAHTSVTASSHCRYIRRRGGQYVADMASGGRQHCSADGPLLLTGATGFLGMELLARYLVRTARPILALVRAGDEREARGRLLAAARAVVPDAERYEHRLVAVRGDIAQPGLGLGFAAYERLAETTTEIVHAAASVEFTLPLARARAINVEGTRRLLALAERCAHRGALRRFAYVSTAYVAGTHRGTFREDDLACGQSFRNTYEQTKWEAEQLVQAHAGQLPIQVFRPSIVVGEATSGWTPAFNVIYGPLKAYATGAALPVMPGRRSAPVDVVPVDYVADAIVELTQRDDGAGMTYSLAAGPQASTVGELVELSASAFERRQPVTLPPSLYRRTLHPLLRRRARGARRRWLERSEAFFPYFAMGVRYDTARARAALEPAGIAPPPLPGYFDRLVGYAQAAQWGRRPLSRVEAVRELQHGRRPGDAAGGARRRPAARPAEHSPVGARRR